MRAALVAAWLAMSALSACVTTNGMNLSLPPARYDRDHPNMHITWETPAMVNYLCRRWAENRGQDVGQRRIGGCASIGTNPCVLILPHRRFYAPHEWERLYRHERAHCWGWVHG